MLIPVPSSQVVEGMVWLPDDALVRAAADGEVETVWVRSETPVAQGARLISLKSPTLSSQREVLQAQIDRSESEYNAAFGAEPLKMQNAQEALTRDRAALAQVDRDLAANVLRAGTSGRFVLSRQEDLDGLQVNRGQVLAYVLDDRPAVIRAVVAQRDIDSVRHRLRSVQVMLDESPGHAMPAHWLREVPAATDRLPGAIMGDRKGGRVPTDPADEDGLRPMEPTYVVDVQLNHGLPRAGGLARVRLDLAPQSLLETAVQRLRQLFLRHFSDIKP
jgi:putative peptide zinc metalloprotease protein